jgi:S1-C subfamily serine protease
LLGLLSNRVHSTSDQNGILIQQVLENSPADKASLHGSFKSITINGEQVLVGGDVIVALNDEEIVDMADFQIEIGSLDLIN